MIQLAQWLKIHGSNPVAWVKNGCNMDWTTPRFAERLNFGYHMEELQKYFKDNLEDFPKVELILPLLILR